MSTSHPSHDEHVLLEATTLAGAAGGAIVGAIAGPVGAVVGGAVGAALGMLAGEVLDQEDGRHAARERALDDEVGVTSGDLGAREAAARGLTALQEREQRDSVTRMADLDDPPPPPKT